MGKEYSIQTETLSAISERKIDEIRKFDFSGDDFISLHKYHVTKSVTRAVESLLGEEVCWQCESVEIPDRRCVYNAEGKNFCSRECLHKYISEEAKE